MDRVEWRPRPGSSVREFGVQKQALFRSALLIEPQRLRAYFNSPMIQAVQKRESKIKALAPDAGQVVVCTSKI
jgi:hypothetical protein